jgi:hypothetical protein
LCRREENFSFGPLPRALSYFASIFASFTRFAVVNLPFAPSFWLPDLSLQPPALSQDLIQISGTQFLIYGRNGMPRCFNSRRA